MPQRPLCGRLGVEPIEPYPNSQSPWRCRCLACGHEVTPQLGNVRAGHAACGYCAGTKVDPVAAEAVMRAAGFIPLEPYPGSGRPWRCRCDRCGNEVSPRYAAVASGAGSVHTVPWRRPDSRFALMARQLLN